MPNPGKKGGEKAGGKEEEEEKRLSRLQSPLRSQSSEIAHAQKRGENKIVSCSIIVETVTFFIAKCSSVP